MGATQPGVAVRAMPAPGNRGEGKNFPEETSRYPVCFACVHI